MCIVIAMCIVFVDFCLPCHHTSAVQAVKVMKMSYETVIYTLVYLAVVAILSLSHAVSTTYQLKHYTLWSCDLVADTLTAGQIAAVVISTLVFIGIVTTIIILCICCLTPTCPCYYRRNRPVSTVVVTTQVPAQPQMVAATDTINHQAPPPYNKAY